MARRPDSRNTREDVGVIIISYSTHIDRLQYAWWGNSFPCNLGGQYYDVATIFVKKSLYTIRVDMSPQNCSSNTTDKGHFQV